MIYHPSRNGFILSVSLLSRPDPSSCRQGALRRARTSFSRDRNHDVYAKVDTMEPNGGALLVFRFAPCPLPNDKPSGSAHARLLENSPRCPEDPLLFHRLDRIPISVRGRYRISERRLETNRGPCLSRFKCSSRCVIPASLCYQDQLSSRTSSGVIQARILCDGAYRASVDLDRTADDFSRSVRCSAIHLLQVKDNGAPRSLVI